MTSPLKTSIQILIVGSMNVMDGLNLGMT